MRIPEFVDNMAKRFDSKLSASDQVTAFLEDCKIHLKKYEGEVLGYAFHEIVAINKSRTHPTVAKIRKVCSDKMHGDFKAVNPVSEEQAKRQENKNIADKFKTTESFKWAAQNMIGVDVLLYVERNGVVPDRETVDKMLRAHKVFKEDLAALDAIREPSRTQMTLWQTGTALNEKNLDYFNAHT